MVFPIITLNELESGMHSGHVKKKKKNDIFFGIHLGYVKKLVFLYLEKHSDDFLADALVIPKEDHFGTHLGYSYYNTLHLTSYTVVS